MPQSFDSALLEAQEALMALGFGSYDARAYCALLVRSPANGYQVARQSGIPRAKVYECLERLVTRGAVVPVESPGREGRMYVPTAPAALLDDIDDNLQSALALARQSLSAIEDHQRVAEVLWRITSQQDLIQRGRRLTDKASRTLHLALWSEEFEALFANLRAAADRGVRIALILYSEHPGLSELQRQCGGAILHSRIKRQAIPVMGRQFVLVADQERCISGSIFSGDDVEGVYSYNLGLVTNAADLVNHEIYLERVTREIGPALYERFGPDLQKLDPFKAPDEL